MLIHPFRGLRFFIPTADAQGTGRAGVLPVAALGLDCKEKTVAAELPLCFVRRGIYKQSSCYIYAHVYRCLVLCKYINTVILMKKSYS